MEGWKSENEEARRFDKEGPRFFSMQEMRSLFVSSLQKMEFTLY